MLDKMIRPVHAAAGVRVPAPAPVDARPVWAVPTAAALASPPPSPAEPAVFSQVLARSRTWLVTPDLLSIASSTGHFLDLNPVWTDTLGWSLDELKQRPFISFVHPDDVESTLAAFELLAHGDPVLRFENRYRCADGSYRWLSWVSVPEGDLFYCTARDITREKAAENERTRLWELSADVLARIDLEAGRFTAVNPAWQVLTGHAERYLLSTPCVELMHADDVGPVLAALRAMAASRQPARLQSRVRTADGTYKPFGWTLSPETDQVHAIVIGRDLSDDVAREQALLHAQEALRQSQKMDAVGQLTGGIAHDFNNLLGAISLSLEMLSRRMALGQHDRAGKYVGMAQSSVRRASVLTQRLLAFSRRQTLDARPLDANQLVDGMADMIRRTVGPEVQLDVQVQPALWRISVDAPQLENALLNLCINARDAMAPQGGRLTVTTSHQSLDESGAREHDLAPGDYVGVCVDDTGAGMPPEIAARAFEPFFTTKPLGQGTGLGLSMVYGFVRQSGGQVRLRSTPGQGTSVTMWFARYHGEAATDDASSAPADAVSGRGRVVLVIDDEPTIRNMVAEALLEAGYVVIEADDGPAGLHVLASGRQVDLLVTDVGLPGGMNGRHVADAARQTRPLLRTLFITGYDESAAVAQGRLDAGMQVLVKPFDIPTLLQRVNQMVDSAPPRPEA